MSKSRVGTNAYFLVFRELLEKEVRFVAQVIDSWSHIVLLIGLFHLSQVILELLLIIITLSYAVAHGVSFYSAANRLSNGIFEHYRQTVVQYYHCCPFLFLNTSSTVQCVILGLAILIE